MTTTTPSQAIQTDALIIRLNEAASETTALAEQAFVAGNKREHDRLCNKSDALLYARIQWRMFRRTRSEEDAQDRLANHLRKILKGKADYYGTCLRAEDDTNGVREGLTLAFNLVKTN